jgi:two-component system, OmpR family, response regulator CpxR
LKQQPAEIFLAEDDEHIAGLVRFLLEKDGYLVTLAHDGAQALERAQGRAWSLLILDVRMPKLDGWQVLTALKLSAGASRMPPVLMLTAQGGVPAYLDPGVEVLKKPFDPAEFTAVVKRMIA